MMWRTRSSPSAGRRDTDRAGAVGSRPHLPRPRSGGREPEPGRGQRRAAGHWQGLRRRTDRAQPRCRGVLTRPLRFGAVPRRPRRPLRAQADADSGHRPGDPGLPAGRLRAVDRGPLHRATLRRSGGGHGVSDHARSDHRAVVWTGAHEVDRAVVGPGRRDFRARAIALGRAAHRVRLGSVFLVFFLFPKKDEEEALLARYHAEDVSEPAKPPATAAPAPR
jgi:hypothetical protein